MSFFWDVEIGKKIFFLIINSIFCCCFILSFVRRYGDIFRIQALQTQKRHREYEMFRIHGTRWVQAGSRLHRTVSRQALLINGEVLDFFVGLLVPCTTTSPSLGLTKYASAREIRCPRWQATRGGRREMRDLHFLYFLCLANECLSFLFLLCLLCLSTLARNPPTRRPNSANFSLCTAPYINPWQRLFPKVVKDRSYFTESASFQFTKLTGLTCSFRYQKPTHFHRKRLNLLTQKPLYLHVTLNILDD